MDLMGPPLGSTARFPALWFHSHGAMAVRTVPGRNLQLWPQASLRTSKLPHPLLSPTPRTVRNTATAGLGVSESGRVRLTLSLFTFPG